MYVPKYRLLRSIYHDFFKIPQNSFEANLILASCLELSNNGTSVEF